MQNIFSRLIRKNPKYLSHIDGLRSLSALRVMLTHIILFSVFFFPQSQYLELLKDPLIKLIHFPDVLLDSFFVISGLVISHSLIKTYKEQGEVNIYQFSIRRCARLFPLYGFTILIALPLYFRNLDNLWANVLFVNNYLSIPHQYAAWTWAIAVEVQFYFLFGTIMWLLSKRIIGKKTCQLLALCFFLLPFIVIPIIINQHHYYHIPRFAFMLTQPESWEFFDICSDKLYIRSCPIFYGVISAYILVYHREKLQALIQRLSPLQVNTIILSLIGVLTFIFANDPAKYLYQSNTVWQTSSYWVMLIQHQLLSIALCTLLLLAEVPKGILMSSFVKILNTVVLRMLGRISYTTYMIHPVIFFLGYQIFFASHPHVTVTQYVLHGFWLIFLTYCFAILCYLFLEQPAMENIIQSFSKSKNQKKSLGVVESSN